MIGTEVQTAIYAALTAAPAIAAVHDSVPKGASFPYITIGDEQVIDDGNACDDGWEVFADIHVWSRVPGYREAKTLMAAAVPRLTAINAISGKTLISVSLDGTRVFRDPDGLTSHGVITVRFVINPA